MTKAIIGSFLSFSEWGFVFFGDFVGQVGVLFENLRHFVSQDFIFVVHLLGFMIEELRDFNWVHTWGSLPASITCGVF